MLSQHYLGISLRVKHPRMSVFEWSISTISLCGCWRVGWKHHLCVATSPGFLWVEFPGNKTMEQRVSLELENVVVFAYRALGKTTHVITLRQICSLSWSRLYIYVDTTIQIRCIFLCIYIFDVWDIYTCFSFEIFALTGYLPIYCYIYIELIYSGLLLFA